MEILFGLLLIVILFCLAAGPVLGLVALLQVVALRRRLERLERGGEGREVVDAEATDSTVAAEKTPGESSPTAEPTVDEHSAPSTEDTASADAASSQPSFNWEMFFGGKALGWIAVVLLLFGAAFFLRYAFENNWIGPMGQVSMGVVAGAGLVVFGWWCDRYRRWGVFSQIVTAAGMLLLYLTTFAAFGFFTILSQPIGGLFLTLIVAAGALLAVLYNKRSLALMTVVGGLLTPLLLQSPHDRYPQLFVYLLLLNAGVLLATYWRRWSAVSLAALAGTQAVFWLWYAGNYHPEKLGWAIGFQAAIFVLLLTHSLATHVLPERQANTFDLIRLSLTAAAGFAAAYTLLREEYQPWLGTLAVVMAAVYAAWARITFWRRGDDPRQTLVALAVAVAFAAIAVPVQLDARWVALGWSAQAAALWWFGLRIRRGALLRVMATVLALLALRRVLLVDTPWETRQPFTPIFNIYALPSLGVAACVIGSVLLAFRHAARLGKSEFVCVRIAGLVGVLLVLTILSVETYGYFDAYAALAPTDTAPTDTAQWRWLGQMALSALWAVYASAILAIGFVMDRAPLRWTALGLYALTIIKVFLFDMADLAELYRIGAFIVVAVILAAAAWAYQRFTPKSLFAGASPQP